MNTLTKNRILQKGDEYSDNGTWKAVPKEDFGLQVMFTKYTQVRRPGEKPILRETPATVKDAPTEVPKRVASPNPISPDSEKPEATRPSAIVTAKAESDSSPVPSHSGTGQRSLPTVVSKKAHTHCAAPNVILTPAVAAVKKAILSGMIEIPFPSTYPDCPWTGRNGTFYARAIDFHVREDLDPADNVIEIRPVGKRGLAQNAVIRFPASIIPQVVDWLLRHQPAPK